MADEKEAAPGPGAANPEGAAKESEKEAPRAAKFGAPSVVVLLVTAAVYAGSVFASWGLTERVVVPKLSGWLALKQAMRLAQEAAAKELPPFGEIYVIEDLVVNPAGSGGTRYLCVSVGLESESAAVIEEVTKRSTQITDCLIQIFSSKSVDELADVNARESIRQEIKARIERLLPEEGLDAVYFVNFVLQ